MLPHLAARVPYNQVSARSSEIVFYPPVLKLEFPFQQVELFVVAVIFWGGIFAFLAYLFLKMMAIEKQLKIVKSQGEGD